MIEQKPNKCGMVVESSEGEREGAFTGARRRPGRVDGGARINGSFRGHKVAVLACRHKSIDG